MREDKIPQATHSGVLKIGDIKIPCAVLEDDTRVLSEHGITTALKSRSGAAKRHKKKAIETGKVPLPIFVASENLIPFISNELYVGLTQPIRYRVGSRVAQGFPAELLPQICDIWLKARDAGVLNKQQEKKCKQAEILVRGLAHVGIIALVDEATGYQYDRDKDALHKILEAYISKEFLPWTKRFPDEFYEQLFRLKGWGYSPLSVKRPKVVGKITNQLVYKQLPPGVLGELKKRTPKSGSGNYTKRFHQSLTPDIGNPHLEKHLVSVITLMRISPNWRIFQRHFARAFGKQQELPLDFDDEEVIDITPEDQNMNN